MNKLITLIIKIFICLISIIVFANLIPLSVVFIAHESSALSYDYLINNPMYWGFTFIFMIVFTAIIDKYVTLK